MAPEIETVPATKIPEVRAFLKAQRALVAWKERYPKAHAELAELETLYNATLDAADKVVRTRGVSCGPFELYQFTAKRDARVFCDLVGRSDFVTYGGDIATTETFDIAPARFDALLARSILSPAMVAKIVTYGPRYHKPARIELP